jgi:hypothetical protein
VQFIEVYYRPDRYHYHFRAQKSGRADGAWINDA